MTDLAREISPTAREVSRPYSVYVLVLLLATYTSAWVDRGILNVLSQAIKEDMGLADWQLGLLTGLSFSIFYSLLGFPLARLAERHSRVNLLSACLVIWSGMTALCGLAGNFVSLFLIRCGVGVGEAGCGPGAHSLIADYFTPERRTWAFAIYNLGVPLGGMLGAIAGGLLTHYVGWRFALVAVGLPGLLLAVLIKLTLREPQRGMTEGRVALQPVPLRDVFRHLFAKRTFRHVAAGVCIMTIGVGASTTFIAPYYLRRFDLNYAEVGTLIGLMNGLSAIAGMLGGAFISGRLVRNGARWILLVPAIALSIAAFFQWAAYLQAQWYLMAALLLVPAVLNSTFLAPAFAVTHNMVDATMHASAAAILYCIMNIIGMAFGPLIAGITIDLFASRLFDSGLGLFSELCLDRTAAGGSAAIAAACGSTLARATQLMLLVTPLFTLWAAIHCFAASRTVANDMAGEKRPVTT